MKLKFFAPLIVVALVAVAVNIGINIPTWRYNRMMETAPRVYGVVETVTDTAMDIRVKFASGFDHADDMASSKLLTVQRDEIRYSDKGKVFDEFVVGDNIFVVGEGELFGNDMMTMEIVYVLYPYS